MQSFADVGDQDAQWSVFAVHVAEGLFGPTALGAVLVLPDPARRGDPSHWAAMVAAHDVTLWNSVPAQLQMLMHYLDIERADLSSLRLALLSGD